MSTDEADSVVGKLLRGGGIVFVGLVVEMGLSFVLKVVIARVLGPVSFGALALGLTTFNILSVLVLVGLDTGIGRYLPRFDDASVRRGVLVSAFQIALPLAVAVGAGLAVSASWIASTIFKDPASEPVLYVFAVAIPISVYVNLTLGGIRGVQKSVPKVYLKNILLPVVRFGAMAAALALGLGAVGVAWAYVVSFLVAALLGTVYLARYTDLFRRTETSSMHTELLSFSAPLVVTSGMALIYDQMDTIVLGYYWPTAEVGIYNVLYPIAWSLLVFLNAFRYLFMPVLSELDSEEKHGEMQRLYQLTTKWVLLATALPFLGVVLFPTQVLQLAFGAEYTAGATALTVLSIAFFSHAIAGPNVDALISIGETRVVMVNNVVTAATNLLLNFLLIPQYALLGAAAATSVSYVLLNALHSYQLYRITGIHPFSRALVRPSVVSFALAGVGYAAVTRLGDVTLQTALAFGAVAAVVYPALVLRFSDFEPEEIEMLLQVEDRIGVSLRPLKRVARALAT